MLRCARVRSSHFRLARKHLYCTSPSQTDQDETGASPQQPGPSDRDYDNSAAGRSIPSDIAQHTAILTASQFMVNMGFGCVIPVLPLFAAQMGMGAMGVGMILSAPSVSRVMLNMPFGEATDRFGRKPLMLAGQLTTALASVATGRLK